MIKVKSTFHGGLQWTEGGRVCRLGVGDLCTLAFLEAESHVYQVCGWRRFRRRRKWVSEFILLGMQFHSLLSLPVSAGTCLVGSAVAGPPSVISDGPGDQWLCCCNPQQAPSVMPVYNAGFASHFTYKLCKASTESLIITLWDRLVIFSLKPPNSFPRASRRDLQAMRKWKCTFLHCLKCV